MTHFSDADMKQTLAASREYTVVLLEQGPQYGSDAAKAIVWEHGRRNMELRADGILDIVCPITDDSPLCGVGIFHGSPEEVRDVMDGDPGVRAGVFTYRVHTARSFPGDSLSA